MTIITFDNSWIQRIWALVKSAGPKSYLVTIFKLITVKVKWIKLQMHSLIFFKKVLRKEINFKPRTFKSFIICSSCQPMPAYQVYPFWPAYCPCIRFLSAKLMLCHRSGGSETCSRTSSSMKNFIGQAMVAWDSTYKNCKTSIPQLKNWCNKNSKKATRKSMDCFTIRAYFLFSKPFR